MNCALILIVAAVAIPCISWSADRVVDAAWEKVQDAMNTLKTPKAGTHEETKARLKSGLTAFDAAMKEFNAASPNDPRRWQAALFDAEFVEFRKILHLGNPGNALDMLNEIVQASDADKVTKSDASAIMVMLRADEVSESKLTEEEWTKMAEAHLKAHPDSRYNAGIASQMEGYRVRADLKSKPLELKFTALDGSEVDFTKLRGKVVVVDFWATWCGGCVAQLSSVQKVYEQYHKKGLEIIGISLDEDKSKLEKFLKDRGMTWAQHFDGRDGGNTIASHYGIRAIPEIWVVNKKGMVVTILDEEDLAEEVEKRLAE